MVGWKLKTTSRGRSLVTDFEKAGSRAAEGLRHVKIVAAESWVAWSDWDFISKSIITPNGQEFMLPIGEAPRRY